MLIFNENSDTVILDNIQGPTLSEYMYVLDLALMDYTLAPLLIFEEVICPSIELSIAGFKFILPSHWNILVTDDETYQLDVVEISELSGKEFKAMVYGMDMHIVELERIVVSDYFPDYKNIGPSLNKNQLLCHPISSTRWVNIAPSDSYNKYLKDKVIGDIT